MNEEFAVEAKDLYKRFGEFVAVNSISFHVKKGEIFGMLGPNGSGKSTTIRMLCGLMDMTSGTAQVAGYDVGKSPDLVKANIGYMSQKFSLYSDLTAYENLRFFASAYGLPRSSQDERIAEIIEITGLRGKENAMAGDLSAGYRQRLALGSAIIHKPRIIFLDEPTSGSDPVSRRMFWDLIYDVTAQGSTVIVSTHYMDEAERADTLILLNGGDVIALGTPADLKRDHIHGAILSIETDRPTESLEIVSDLPGVRDVALYGTSIHVASTEPDALRSAAEAALTGAGMRVKCIEQVTPTLEDVFVALIGNMEKGQIE